MIILLITASLLLISIIFFARRTEKNKVKQEALHAQFDLQIKQAVLDNKEFPIREISDMQYLHQIEYNPANYEKIKLMIANNEVDDINEDDFTKEDTLDELLLVQITSGDNKHYLALFADGLEFNTGAVLMKMYELE